MEYMRIGNATKAYAKAYPNNKKSARKYGYLLTKHPYVTFFINQKNKKLEKQMDKKIINNRERIINELDEILKATKGEKKYNAALKALDQISKIVGAYAPEKSEVEHKGITINYIKPEDKKEDK